MLQQPGPDGQPWQPDPPHAYCPRCGGDTGPGEATATGCHRCAHRPVPWDAAVRLSAYEGPLADAIHQMKFARHWRLAHILGQRLGQALTTRQHGRFAQPLSESNSRSATISAACPPAAAHAPFPGGVVHVPMHWRRRAHRGFDQAALMAEALAATANLPHAPLLRRIKHRPPQSTVVLSDRQRNIRGAYTLAPVDLRGQPVILVDDVLTTGATLTQCTRLLKQAGASPITIAIAAVGHSR